MMQHFLVATGQKVVFTWRHRGHVGGQNNREKVFWEFDSIIMQNTSHNLLLFCAPTWPSHHVTENHLYQFIQPFLNFLRKSCLTDWLNSWTWIISYTLINLDSVIAPNYHSTALALIDLISNISSAIDRNESTSAGIFLDLSKAFHTINHKILCHKLQHYGIRDTTLSWIES